MSFRVKRNWAVLILHNYTQSEHRAPRISQYFLVPNIVFQTRVKLMWVRDGHLSSGAASRAVPLADHFSTGLIAGMIPSNEIRRAIFAAYYHSNPVSMTPAIHLISGNATGIEVNEGHSCHTYSMSSTYLGVFLFHHLHLGCFLAKLYLLWRFSDCAILKLPVF